MFYGPHRKMKRFLNILNIEKKCANTQADTHKPSHTMTDSETHTHLCVCMGVSGCVCVCLCVCVYVCVRLGLCVCVLRNRRDR